VTTLVLPSPEGRVDLNALVDELGKRGCTGVLVEGGSRLLGGFFDAGLVDKVVAFVAPKLFGSEAAPGPVGGAGVETPDRAIILERVETEILGDDLLVAGYVRH
jgi:diaminohydroxyphosphoribosylaminopyrimidine deaminase/5-amino-6-(5-phosphoribosylamino)uracil reductase